MSYNVRLDDIVIGAPLYSPANAKDLSYEKGRIYIAYQTKEVWNPISIYLMLYKLLKTSKTTIKCLLLKS